MRISPPPELCEGRKEFDSVAKGWIALKIPWRGLYTKEKLLDNGDRWEVSLVRNIERDAPFR